MGSLHQLFDKRKIKITKEDAITILNEENPFFDKLSKGVQERLDEMSKYCLEYDTCIRF